MGKFQKIIERAPGFNDVSAWLTPNGELVISISHRITSDEEVLIRVRVEDDAVLTDDEAEDWEDENTRTGRLNHGGNW